MVIDGLISNIKEQSHETNLYSIRILFLIVTLLIESVLFVLLYYSLVNTRVNEEMTALLKRGNSHRDVLEKYFDKQTISHVALMESEAETTVVITNANKDVLAKSNEINTTIKIILKRCKHAQIMTERL